MGKKAKLFQNGGSQAVRLPSEYRMAGEEVHVEKVGDTLVLRPVLNSWVDFFSSPSTVPEDFLVDRGDDEAQERNLF